MEERLKHKLKTFLATTLHTVNNIPQDDDRKRIVLDLSGKLTPMNIIHKMGIAKSYDGSEIQLDDGGGIVVDHSTFQFDFEESRDHAFKVIDSISHSERRRLLYAIREVVWDFHNLVAKMIEPYMDEEELEAHQPS